jgi:hypothetical protein
MPEILSRVTDPARVNRAISEARANLAAALQTGYVTREEAIRSLIGTGQVTSRGGAEAIVAEAEAFARNATGEAAAYLQRAREAYSHTPRPSSQPLPGATGLPRPRPYQCLSDQALASRILEIPRDNVPGSIANELRYERYLRRRGRLTYDEWFPISRGSRSGGPNHQAIQNRLAEARGARREVTFGDRAADVFVPSDSATGRPTIHQIGEINAVRGDPIARERLAIEDIVDYLRGQPGGGNYEIVFWNKATPLATEPVLRIRVADFPPPNWHTL